MFSMAPTPTDRRRDLFDKIRLQTVLVVLLGEECFGIAGCPGYRTLGCLKNRCGACCRAMDICKFHEEADAKKAAIAATMNP